MKTQLPKTESPAVDYSPEELVSRIKMGDKQAETLFCIQYRKGLLMMLKQRTKNFALAEDLTQETLMTVLVRLRKDGIEQPEYLNRFLQQTAKFTFIGWLRKSANQMEFRETVDDAQVSDQKPDEDLAKEQTRVSVRALIKEMKVARDREVLYRYYVRDQGKPFICDALDLSTTHFDRVINRARNRFRELLEKEASHVI